MIRSLRARLLLAVGLVVVAAVVGVGLYSSYMARLAFTAVEVEEVVEVRRPEGGPPERSRVRTERWVPLAEAGIEDPASRETRFMATVNRAIVGGVVLAGVLALAGTALLANRILRPVRDLTRAAGRLAEGNLGERVPVAARDEIGRLAAAFNAMAEGLERMDRSRRELVHDVAHELRTPLTSLRCQIEALEDGLARPDAPALASLREEVTLLARLVDDLQDLTLAAAGRLTLEPSRLDLAAEVRKAVHSVAVADGGARLEIEVPDGLEAVADPGRLQQILRNLLANALRHTPSGAAVRITARRQDGGAVEVAVEDEGPGIPAEHLPHLFDRFYRTDPSRTRTTGGAGLGLAIVKQLVEAHGGQVGVESATGAPGGRSRRGSRFWFTLRA